MWRVGPHVSHCLLPHMFSSFAFFLFHLVVCLLPTLSAHIVKDLQDGPSCCPGSPRWPFLLSRISRMEFFGVQDLQNRVFWCPVPPGWHFLMSRTDQSADDWELLAGQGCENPPITKSQKPEELKKRPPTSTCCSFWTPTFWGCPLLSSGTCLKAWLKCMKLSSWTVLE